MKFYKIHPSRVRYLLADKAKQVIWLNVNGKVCFEMNKVFEDMQNVRQFYNVRIRNCVKGGMLYEL